MIFIFAVIAAIVLFFVSTNLKKMGKKQESNMSLIMAVAAIAFAIFRAFTVIPAGTVGVVDFLGKVNDETLKPGVNIVNPIAKIIKYSFKTQELKENMTVPSKEGLPVQLEISLWYRVDPAMANEIYKTVDAGDYLNVILIPQFRSVVRGVTAKFEAKALYTGAREQLATQIVENLQKIVGEKGIIVEDAILDKLDFQQD